MKALEGGQHLVPLYKLLRPGDLLGDRPSRLHVRTQRPTEYRIGGLILVHMSGTNHSPENAHFSGGANELRTLDKERAQPRWWRRPRRGRVAIAGGKSPQRALQTPP